MTTCKLRQPCEYGRFGWQTFCSRQSCGKSKFVWSVFSLMVTSMFCTWKQFNPISVRNGTTIVERVTDCDRMPSARTISDARAISSVQFANTTAFWMRPFWAATFLASSSYRNCYSEQERVALCLARVRKETFLSEFPCLQIVGGAARSVFIQTGASLSVTWSQQRQRFWSYRCHFPRPHNPFELRAEQMCFQKLMDVWVRSCYK